MFGMGLFDNDPFFNGVQQQHMRRINEMNNMVFNQFSPFRRQFALEDANTNNNNNSNRNRQLDVRHHSDPFNSFFSHFDQMQNMVNRTFQQVHQQMQNPNLGENGAVYQQSSVMTYSNDGSGQPKIYQASTSTRVGPGGVKETRKAVRDSHKGIEKMAVGHHIGDRAHVVERKKNTRTGDTEENKEYINIDDSEEENFEREFRERATRPVRGGTGRDMNGRYHKALPESKKNKKSYKKAHYEDNEY